MCGCGEATSADSERDANDREEVFENPSEGECDGVALKHEKHFNMETESWVRAATNRILPPTRWARQGWKHKLLVGQIL